MNQCSELHGNRRTPEGMPVAPAMTKASTYRQYRVSGLVQLYLSRVVIFPSVARVNARGLRKVDRSNAAVTITFP